MLAYTQLYFFLNSKDSLVFATRPTMLQLLLLFFVLEN